MRGGGTGKQMLAQQCSMLATTPSLLTAPPIPCLSVAPSLSFGPSHNLCPLSGHTERLESRGERCLYGFPRCSLNHGTEAAFFIPEVSTQIWTMTLELSVQFYSAILRVLLQE